MFDILYDWYLMTWGFGLIPLALPPGWALWRLLERLSR